MDPREPNAVVGQNVPTCPRCGSRMFAGSCGDLDCLRDRQKFSTLNPPGPNRNQRRGGKARPRRGRAIA